MLILARASCGACRGSHVRVELSSDLANRVLPTRKLRRRGMEQIDTKAAKKKITTGVSWVRPRSHRVALTRMTKGASVTEPPRPGPVMSYSLKETEIFDDLYQIRKVGPRGHSLRIRPPSQDTRFEVITAGWDRPRTGLFWWHTTNGLGQIW